jgi:hypothetical protein
MPHSRNAKLPKKVNKFISEQIRIEKEAGYPIKQAIAISYSMARKEFPEYSF